MPTDSDATLSWRLSATETLHIDVQASNEFCVRHVHVYSSTSSEERYFVLDREDLRALGEMAQAALVLHDLRFGSALRG